MKLLICLVLLVPNAAGVQDMSGKMFVFLEKSDDGHVKVNTAERTLSAVTLCHRSFTDLKRSHSFLSLTTPDHISYAFNTLYEYKTKEIIVWVKTLMAYFYTLDYAPNKWNSICTAWDSGSGVVQLWMNGQQFAQKNSLKFNITGQPRIVLGQEQSTYDSPGFHHVVAFVGMLTDVHMWDHVRSACEIQRYMAEESFTPGNVVNWAALDFQIRGRITIDDKQTCHLSTP